MGRGRCGYIVVGYGMNAEDNLMIAMFVKDVLQLAGSNWLMHISASEGYTSEFDPSPASGARVHAG